MRINGQVLDAPDGYNPMGNNSSTLGNVMVGQPYMSKRFFSEQSHDGETGLNGVGNVMVGQPYMSKRFFSEQSHNGETGLNGATVPDTMRQAWNSYWATAIVNKPLSWAGGTLTKTSASTADYVFQGVKNVIHKTDDFEALTNAFPGIAAQWKAQYSFGDSGSTLKILALAAAAFFAIGG
jgi:hypothetical protein